MVLVIAHRKDDDSQLGICLGCCNTWAEAAEDLDNGTKWDALENQDEYWFSIEEFF